MDDLADRRTTLLTVKEVAARLHLTRNTVYRLIRSGELPASDMGQGRQTRYRIRPEAVDTFVTAREGR